MKNQYSLVLLLIFVQSIVLGLATASAQEKSKVLFYLKSKSEQTQAAPRSSSTTPANTGEDEDIYTVAEKMPEFPGGQQALFRYLADNVVYPSIAKENGIQGRAICQFVVEKDGSISGVEVTRSAGDPSLDKEAIRVIKAMPKWSPGKQKGKLVRVKYTLPVNFRLN